MRKLESNDIVPAAEVKALIMLNKQLKRKAALQPIPKKPLCFHCPVCMKQGKWVLVEQHPSYLGRVWILKCPYKMCVSNEKNIALTKEVIELVWAARTNEYVGVMKEWATYRKEVLNEAKATR